MPKRCRSASGLKGSSSLVKCRSSGKKCRQLEREDARSSFPNLLDDIYDSRARKTAFEEDDEELGNEDSEEEEEYKENEMKVRVEPAYENLLFKLQACSNLKSNGNQNRKHKDNSEEDRDSECKSHEEYVSEDYAARSSKDRASHIAVHEDESDAQNGSREENVISQENSSERHSKFDTHVAHKLSKQDIEELKGGWEYKWSTPALDRSYCRWMGTGDNFLKDADAAANAHHDLKQTLLKHWLEVYDTSGGRDFPSSKQRSFFSLCNSYRDILHHQKRPFYLKRSDEDSSIMDAYIMHSLNHIFKTRDIVTKNDANLPKDKDEASVVVMTSKSFLDQGLTRPKVLIILPLRSIALRLVRRLIQLTPSANKASVEYINRFNKEFGVDTGENEDELEGKDSSDYQTLFAGNNNDNFMVGIKFTRRSIKLYSDFHSSDVIVASPRALDTKISEAEKGKDVDYLSSIEILIVDHADVINMQNWTPVKTIVENLNCKPCKSSNVMRAREWYVDELAQFYRQTIILSSYLTPDINAFFEKHCFNFEGKVRLSCKHTGVLPKVIPQVSQVYKRFDVKSIDTADDDRFYYFAKEVFPEIKDSRQGGIMLFVSSMLDCVRIRNFLDSQNASFCLLYEETEAKDVSRPRNWFLQGKRKIMVYSERLHFYRGYKIRGVRKLIFYSLPERKEFYPEVLNMLEGSEDITVLFSRLDHLQLERIVGTTAAKRIKTSETGPFIFTQENFLQ